MKKNEKKTFIYLIPKRKKKHYNDSSESIIIKKFIKLGHTIIPKYNFYFINIISKLLTNKIDGIIVNSIKIHDQSKNISICILDAGLTDKQVGILKKKLYSIKVKSRALSN